MFSAFPYIFVLLIHMIPLFSEKMITSETLDGVPLLLLANKQDLEVSY